MKAKLLLLMLLILLSANGTYGQSFIDLYENYLPSSVLENQTLKNDIDRSLRMYGEINPDLIYLYLTNLELKFVNKIQDSDSNLTYFLASSFAESKKMKTNWAKLYLAMIEDRYSSSLKIKKFSSYFSKSVFKGSKIIKTDPPVLIDENKQAFFTYLYLTRNKTLKYDPNLDYNSEYRKESEKIVQKFQDEFKSDDLITRDEKENIIGEIFEYPYLFKDGYLEEYTNLTNFYIDEQLDKYFADDYNSKNEILLNVSFQTEPLEFDEEIAFTDPFNINFKYDYDIEIKNSIVANLGFKLKTMNGYNNFSYWRVLLGYSISQSRSTTLKETALFSGTRAIIGLSYNGEYRITDYRDFNSYGISVQITTPVYYFNRNIYFEAGINYTLQNVSFKTDFIKDGVVETPYTDEDPVFFEDKTLNIDEYYHLIYPVFNANFAIQNSFDIQINYLMPFNFRVGLTYHFQII